MQEYVYFLCPQQSKRTQTNHIPFVMEVMPPHLPAQDVSSTTKLNAIEGLGVITLELPTSPLNLIESNLHQDNSITLDVELPLPSVRFPIRYIIAHTRVEEGCVGIELHNTINSYQIHHVANIHIIDLQSNTFSHPKLSFKPLKNPKP